MSSSQWQAYLQTYNEQRKLEKYQQERKLSKPNTTRFTVMLYAGLLIMILAGFAVLLFALSPFALWTNTLFFILYLICIAESFGRLLGIKIVECYQHYATEETRRKCKCVPSCSEYAIICLKKFELFHALYKIRRRLFVICKGFDYIIDNP